MRDYIIHEAQARHAYGRFSALALMFRNRSLRQQIKQLLNCSDHALREIGVTRLQLLQWRDLPWSADIAWEMERRGLGQPLEKPAAQLHNGPIQISILLLISAMREVSSLRGSGDRRPKS